MSSQAECVVCGERDFELISGLYFCANCQTQSQDLRQEEGRDYFEAGERLSQLRIKTPKVKTSAVTKDDDVDRHGRPWRTQEGFTIIIREQVQALIQLGADPQIQDIVLRVWMLYLSKTGAAFNSLVPKEEKVIPKYKMERDEQLLTVENACVTPNRKMTAMMKVYGGTMSSKQAELKQRKEQLEEALEAEEFYEEDDPFAGMETSVHLNISTTSNEVRNWEGSKWKRLGDLTWMSLKRCTAITYIGLLYTHNLTIPADYIRWIYNGKIPFEGLSSKFPPDMKFFTGDAAIFDRENGNIKPRLLREEASKMMKFLGLNDITLPPVGVLCSRFILQLNLPNELHGYVDVFLKQNPMKLKTFRNTVYRHIVETDIIAMATIIVILKLLFGLNGDKEFKLSKYARVVNGMNLLERPLFEFDSWLRDIHRRRKAEKNLFTTDVKDITRITDVGEFLRSFEDAFGEGRLRSKKSQFMNKDYDARMDMARSLRQLNNTSQTNWEGDFIERLQGAATFGDETSQNIQCMSDQNLTDDAHFLAENDVQIFENVRSENLSSENTPSVSSASAFNKTNASGENITSKTGVQNKNDESYMDKEIDFSNNFVEFVLGKNPNQEIRHKQTDQGDSSDDETSQSMHQSNSRSSKREKSQQQSTSLNSTIPRVNEDFIRPFYWLCSRHEDQKPKSYESLLNLCSSVILCEEETLHTFVIFIELMYIVGVSNTQILNRAEKFKLKKFLKEYFEARFESDDQ